MTKDEKFKAIIDRIKGKDLDFDPSHISAMVIVGYLDDLAEKKLVETAYSMTPTGKLVRAICEEFDWKPSDNDILEFVNGMVEAPDRPAFMFLLKKYRDDREGLFNEYEKFNESEGENPPTS